MTLLEARGLSHRFPDRNWGLREVDFKILDDEFLVVAGINGSGKTLLMHHLLGLVSPTSGTISYRGRPINRVLDELRQRVGLVFQNPETQFLGSSVTEDVAFGLEYSGRSAHEIEQRVSRALRRMSISHLADRRPFFLSGGEQRKVAIAGLLARDPEILILDEPFIGLDYPGVRSILEALLDLKNERRTIVVITHDIEKVLAHAQRLVVMKDGRIVESGEPERIAASLESHEIRCPPIPVSSMSWICR